MDTVSTHLHLTEQAFGLLDKYTGPRGRGQFISQLIVDYHRRQLEGDGVIAALRAKAPQAAVSQRRKGRK